MAHFLRTYGRVVELVDTSVLETDVERFGSSSLPSTTLTENGDVFQLVEKMDLKSIQCRFESDCPYLEGPFEGIRTV